MKITRVRLFRYSLPLAEVLHLRQQMLTVREGLVIRLSDDSSHEGWGEIAPLSGFSTESLADAETEALTVAERLTDISLPDPTDDPMLADMLFSTIECPSVRSGVESAWLNLAADQSGSVPATLLRPGARTTVSVNGLLSGTSNENVKQAATLRDQGYTAVKLKVGRLPVHTEIELVHKVRETLGTKVTLRLDANRAWEYEPAMQFVEGVADANIEYIEEPLSFPDALDQFAANSPVPIALDETLNGLSADKLDDFSSCRAIILKPTVLGGPLKCLTLSDRARNLGMRAVVSSAIESSLGIYCCANLAAAINVDDIPAGLDTIRWFGQNLLTEPLDKALPKIQLKLSRRLPELIDKSLLTEIDHG